MDHCTCSFLSNETGELQFEADAELVSDEVVQDYYAAILAGETILPGAFGFRTLDALRRLDPKTLAKAEKTFAVAITGASPEWGWLRFVPASFGDLRGQYARLGLHHMDLVDLADAGLVVYPSTSTLQPDATYVAPSGEKFSVKKPQYVMEGLPKVYTLTRAGSELQRLATPRASSTNDATLIEEWLTNPTIVRFGSTATGPTEKP